MTVQEFLASDGAPPKPVYLFCPGKSGKNDSFEPVLAERAVDRLVSRYVDPTLRDLCYNAYYAEETDPAEVVSVAETFPFLAERRVILVHNAERYQAESSAKAVHRYLGAPAETTILILVASQIDRRSKLYKNCGTVGEVIECPELKQHEVALWINNEVRQRDKSIDPAAVREIVDRTGTRLSDVGNAVNVVCGYAGERANIMREDVVRACADVAEEEVWALTDAISQSDTGRAIEVLRAIIDLGKSEFEIVATINWLLKTAYTVALGGKAEQRLNPYVAKKARPLADKLGLGKFSAAFALLMETEVMFRTTGVDRALALELLVVKLAAPVRRRTA